VVRAWQSADGRPVQLRDAGTHYELPTTLACAQEYCDGVSAFTLRAPAPGAIVPAFRSAPVAGSWRRGQAAEIRLLLPRRVVETPGTRLLGCLGLAGNCEPQTLLPGG
jgi:hypothetical protein